MKTIIATIKAMDVSHAPVATIKNTGPGHKWSSMVVQDIDIEHRDDFIGYPTFQWMNSDVDAQAAQFQPGDRVRIMLNESSIPLKIESATGEQNC